MPTPDDFETDDLADVLPDREPTQSVKDAADAHRAYVDNRDDDDYQRDRDTPRNERPTASALRRALERQQEAQKAARSGVEAEAEPEEPEATGDAPEQPEDASSAPVKLMSREALQSLEKLRAGKPLTAAEGKRLVEAVARREDEVSKGFARYKDLGRFAEHYEKQGATIAQALEAYAGIDALMQRDFMGAQEMLFQRYKLNPQMVAAAFVQRYGLPQGFNGQSGPSSNPAAIRQLVEYAQGLEGKVKTLEGQIVTHSQHAERQRQQAAADKARKASQGLNGAPTHGVPARTDKPAGSTREALYAAISKQGVRVS